jgi:MFS transporter, UMF1 family
LGVSVTDATGDNEPATGKRREQRAWYVYDWANSAFSTTVVTVFLGPYLTTVTRTAAGSDGFVHPFGIPIRAESFFPYVVSVSVLIQVMVLPTVGAIADRTGRRRALLAGFAYGGALATMGLYFLRGQAYLLGGGLFVVANMAFGASVVVYNSFLPDIADPYERDRTSSRGWALGYLGGGLLLVANLVLFQRHAAFGLTEGEAVRISLFSAGAWWALFSAIPLLGLRDRPPRPLVGSRSGSVRELWVTLRAARSYPRTLLFLGAYLLYNDGIQTVIALASTFGAEELGLPQPALIGSILMVQFVAFAGALLLGFAARRFGAKRIVLASLVVWMLVVVASYGLREGAVGQFFALAFVIGIVLGGSQALSRSLFSQLIPDGQHGAYFSLYEISERGTAWLGTFVFGVVLQWTGSYRAAIVSLVIFFVGGAVLLFGINVRRAIREAGNPVPDRV